MGDIYDLVIECENQLGWRPTGSKSLHRERAAACVRLERAITAADPPVTITDVRLAIAWCRRGRQSIEQPTHLLRFVEDAKRAAVKPDVAPDISQAMAEAIAWEGRRNDEDSRRWMSRLVRCHDAMRADVLCEWQEAGRGS